MQKLIRDRLGATLVTLSKRGPFAAWWPSLANRLRASQVAKHQPRKSDGVGLPRPDDLGEDNQNI